MHFKFVDNAEDLDVVMLMYNLIEYSKNYLKTSGKLEDDNSTKNAEIVVPLKYLSNFWRTLDMPLINREVPLTLTWTENCVITNKAARDLDSWN